MASQSHKKGFVAYGVYWQHLFAQFIKKFSPGFDTVAKTTPVWKYDKKAVCDPMPGVIGFSPRIWQWLMAQTSVRPSRLGVSGCCKNFFPEGETTTFWLKFRTAHSTRETSSLPTAGFTSAPKRCETSTLGTEVAVHSTERQAHNLAPKLAI